MWLLLQRKNVAMNNQRGGGDAHLKGRKGFDLDIIRVFIIDTWAYFLLYSPSKKELLINYHTTPSRRDFLLIQFNWRKAKRSQE